MTIAPAAGVPDFGPVRFSTLKQALFLGWRDFCAIPGYGLFFGSAYALAGVCMMFVTWLTGQSYWLIFAAIGFPLLGPFAAVGIYEVSRRRAADQDFAPRDIFRIVIDQGARQLPSLCAIIVFVFLFWFFLAHMIFALFLGLATMTHISTSYDVFLTANGLMMLGVGSLIGACFALLLFMITVLALPLLLDRELDFVTAMIVSFRYVQSHPREMIAWGVFLATACFVAMVPMFLGLLVILPWLGHSSWHLYALLIQSNKKGA